MTSSPASVGAGTRTGRAAALSAFLAQAHLALAALFLALTPIAPAPRDIAFGLLAACAVVRLPSTLRLYRPLITEPVCWLLLAWPAWVAISLAWSEDIDAGVTELRAFRAVMVPFLLWPVIPHRRVLVYALLSGVAALNVLQGFSFLGALDPPRPDHAGRYSGLVHPIQAAASCGIAICWLLAGAIGLRGRERGISIALLLSAGAGLIATGSRGPWIAVSVGVVVLLALLAMSRPALRRPVVIAAVCIALAALAATFLEPVRGRVRDAYEETRTFVVGGEIEGSVGGRVWMWKAAWEEFSTHPWIGVGAGSFAHAAVRTKLFERDYADLHQWERIRPDHAHSTFFHTLATTGAVGGLLVTAFFVTVLARSRLAPGGDLLLAGAIAALLTWIVGAAFDSYHLSGQTSYQLMFLVTLLLPGGPRSPQPVDEERPS